MGTFERDLGRPGNPSGTLSFQGGGGGGGGASKRAMGRGGWGKGRNLKGKL